MLVTINEDLYDINWRVKGIDSLYSIVWDTETEKYLLFHNGKQQLTLPYDRLDGRSIDYIIRTKRENWERLTAEMDKENERQNKEALKLSQDKFENEVSRALRNLD